MRTGKYGEYYQDCFIIKLNIPLDFENLANSDDADHLGTFFHEYFHFLQNLSTTYGLFSMSVFYAKMLDIFHKLANSTDTEISSVIHFNERIDPFIIKQELALGDMDEWTYAPCDFLIVESANFIKDDILEELGYGEWSLPQVKVLMVRNGKAEHKTVLFGAMCIMESMADMMDLHLYGKSKANEFVQYDICKKLWYYYFDNQYDESLIFRCCEYSLMFENPGHIYNLALSVLSKELQSGVIKRISKDEIDVFFMKQIKPCHKQTYKMFYQEIIKLTKELFPENNNYTANISKYVSNCYNFFYKIRKSNWLSLTTIYNTDPEIAKHTLIKCMHIAVPLVINSANDIFTPDQIKDDVGLGVYASYYVIYNLFYKNPNMCELNDICKHQNDGLTRDYCKNNPLLSEKEDGSCILSQVLNMWNCKVERIL